MREEIVGIIEFVRDKYGINLVEAEPEPSSEPEPEETGGTEFFRVVCNRWGNGVNVTSAIFVIKAPHRSVAEASANDRFRELTGVFPTDVNSTVAVFGRKDEQVWIAEVVNFDITSKLYGHVVGSIPVIARSKESAISEAREVAFEQAGIDLAKWEDGSLQVGSVVPFKPSGNSEPLHSRTAFVALTSGSLYPTVIRQPISGEASRLPVGTVRVLPLFVWLRMKTGAFQDLLDVGFDIQG